MQPNTWKYFPFSKIAFSENIYFLENILHEPNTAKDSKNTTVISKNLNIAKSLTQFIW